MRIAAIAAALFALALPTMAPAKTTPPAADGGRSGIAAAAARGDAEAQYQMGLAARKARGPRAEADRTAYSWFTLAASNGSLPAAIEAARACENGTGTPQDIERAGQWWYRAAGLGDAEARTRWVTLFVSGRIASVGGVEGAGWIAEIARRGDPRAAVALASAYEHGNGVAIDTAEAESWYRLAALTHADVEARFRLGRMLLGRPAAWRVLENEEWAAKESDRKGKPLGAVWYASKPEEDADKATLFRPGIEQAVYWLTLAARQGHADAQYELGKAMAEGLELPIDLPAAIGWLRAASAQGHPAATMLLAEMTAKGQGGFAKDPVRAHALYDRAAALGQPGAAAARDALARGLTGRQLARARQISQDLRDDR